MDWRLVVLRFSIYILTVILLWPWVSLIQVKDLSELSGIKEELSEIKKELEKINEGLCKRN